MVWGNSFSCAARRAGGSREPRLGKTGCRHEASCPGGAWCLLPCTQRSLPSPRKQLMPPMPRVKGEMHLREASQRGPRVGLQRRVAGGLLPKEGCVGPGPSRANPGAAGPGCRHSPGHCGLGIWGRASGAGITSGLCHAQSELPRKLSEMAAGKHGREIPVLPVAQLQPRPSGTFANKTKKMKD